MLWVKYNTICYTNLSNLSSFSFPPVGFRCEWMRERDLTVWVCVKGWTGIWGWAPCLWRTHVNYERKTALPSHPIAPCLRQKRYVQSARLSVFHSFLNFTHSLSLSQMVIPADPEEMEEFQSQCICQCQYVVDITFPVAYILLPSKEAFLSIYNRYRSTLTHSKEHWFQIPFSA